MSVPFYIFAPTTARVVKPAFAAEKQHMILAVKNSLIPTSVPFIEFESAADYALSFGQDAVYSALVKYFGFLSKSGTAPDKAVIMRWYDTDTAPFAVGTQLPKDGLAAIQDITDGTLTYTLDGTETTVSSLDFSSDATLSAVAATLKTAIGGGVTVAYSSVTGGFVITAPSVGSEHTIGAFGGDDDVLSALGLAKAVLSQGVDAETFATFCDRVLDANPAGFTITTLETVTESDKLASVAWLQQVVSEQTLYTNKKLTFNFDDLDDLTSFSNQVKALSYTGVTMTYDPNGENVNILDAACSASTDYDNGQTKNYNFQPAVGYTSVTNLGHVTEYQDGQTNVGLFNQLNGLGACFVYSIGYGSQEQKYYGTGVMLGAFGTEDIQANQAALESRLQIAIVNGLASVEKLKLRGTDAESALSGLIDPSFKNFQRNGAIAYDGKLADSDRLTIVNSFGSSDVADAIENNGYYFQIEELTATDTAKRQRRVKYAYLAGGVINKVVFNAAVYGA